LTAARRRLADGTRHFLPVLALLGALFVFLSLTQSSFLTQQNIENLLTGVSILWVVSLGMTFVLITAGLDLSVPAILALSGVLLAKLLGLGLPDWTAVLIVLAFGTALGGVLNGVSIGILGLSFFVVTLASLTAMTGAVNLWSDSQTTFVTSSLVGDIGVGKLAGLPTPVWIMAATFGLALLVQTRTYFGRDVYAVGGSLEAARLSGVSTTRVLVAVYAISGLCAALGGIIQVGRIGAASPQVGGDIALQAVAAVLLGGTLLTGGFGGVGGTAVGVLFIGVLQNGLGIAGVSAFWQQVVTGVILFLAVVVTSVRSGRLELRWPGRPRAPLTSDAAATERAT
jgi:ribose transport system permease protein